MESKNSQSLGIKIGQLLLSNTSSAEREEKLFEIVNQLNYGVELIVQQSDRAELAQLNLTAGQKAKTATAYAASLEYFTVGISLLAVDSWHQSYELTLALYESAAEAAYLSGDFQLMEKLVDIVLQQARTLLDKVKVYDVKIQSYGAQNKLREAIDTAVAILKLLGIAFPEKPCQSDIDRSLAETMSLWAPKSQLRGDAYDEQIMLPLHQETKNHTLMFKCHLQKVILCCLFGDREAINNANIAEQYLDGVVGYLDVPLFHFYDSLAILNLSDTNNTQNSIIERVVANQKKMEKWGHHAPTNYLHKFYLVEAERHRVLGQKAEAIELYDRAITLAKENEYLNEQALALELAAKFYLEWGKPRIACDYLIDVILKQKPKQLTWNLSFEDLPKLLSTMQEGVNRIRNISTSLRTFSRADTEHKIPFNIHDGINSTIMILKHRLKASETRPCIEVIKDYGDLPLVECFPGQLNQVFMNLLANAIDALEEGIGNREWGIEKASSQLPQIWINTEVNLDKTTVVIRIKDNGIGMSKEVKQKIFDHLFTTKIVGKGTGLGLSIARQIVVDKHGGNLSVHSEPGKGAEFVITIPVICYPLK